MSNKEFEYTGGGAVHTYPGLPDSEIYYDIEGATVQQRFRLFTKKNAKKNALAYREKISEGVYV